MGQVLCCGAAAEAKEEAKEDDRKQEASDIKDEEEGSAKIVRRLSRSCNPAYSWLAELGLERYAAAFVNAGFDDWSLLGILDDNDLALIEMHNDLTILPGHRKKLLLAAKQMSCKDPALAKRRRRMRRSRRSTSNRISPLQPGAFDLAASQLSASANTKARKQLDAQNAALQRRASSVDKALTQQRNQQEQQQIAPASPQSSPEIPLGKGMGQGRCPPPGFKLQASRVGSKRSSSGTSGSSTDSSVTVTSASNAEGMEGPGYCTRHKAHLPPQHEDAESPQHHQQHQQQHQQHQHADAKPQQHHEHRESSIPPQQQRQQVEQPQRHHVKQTHLERQQAERPPQSAQGQQPTTIQCQQAEDMHADVQAARPELLTPFPAMPLLTKQTSSGRRYVPMGTIPSRSWSRARQNNNAMPSGDVLAAPEPASKLTPDTSPPQSHGRQQPSQLSQPPSQQSQQLQHPSQLSQQPQRPSQKSTSALPPQHHHQPQPQPQPQRPSQRSPSPAASRRAEDPLPAHIKPAWETCGKEQASIPRQMEAQGRPPSGRKVWAAAGLHADKVAGPAAAGGHKRPWSCPSGQQQERQKQGQKAVQQQQQQQQQQKQQQTHVARPLSPMHSHTASPDQHQHCNSGHHRPQNSRSSSARSQKTLAVPVKADDETSPWNQDLALCIAGAAYVPKNGGQPTGSSNPAYEHQPSTHQQGWSRSPPAAHRVMHESEGQSRNPSCNPQARVGHIEHLHMAGTCMQVSSNPAYAPSRGSPVLPGREKRRRAAYVQTPPPPIQDQPTLSSSSSSSFASSGDNQTLDPAALAEIIGPDSIRGPPLANGRTGHSALSVTFGDGIGDGVGNLQQKQQKGVSRASSPESRLVAQKLEAIIHGLEQKGIGRGKPKTVDRHTSKRAELQQLHAQVEAQLERLRNPPLEANAQHATPAVPGDPDLWDIEHCIARKLNELEAQLAQG